MVNIRPKKVGIVACSGEEYPEGTVTRLAALQVLEALRPEQTVTICLPLFLAGGEGDRAFARYFPTITVDGCDLRCAARATELYSGKPAASLMVTEIAADYDLGQITGRRELNEAGQRAVQFTAGRIAEYVDEILGKDQSQSKSQPIPEKIDEPNPEVTFGPEMQPCACGSGIPVQMVQVGNQTVSLVALPLIFEQLYRSGKEPTESIAQELVELVRIYNPLPSIEESDFRTALLHEYRTYCLKAPH